MSASMCAILFRTKLKTFCSIHNARNIQISVSSYYATGKEHKPNAIAFPNHLILREWRTIYQMPLARWAAAFNRLKIYQGIFTAAGTPVMYNLEQYGQVSTNSTAVFAAVGLSGLLTLAISSWLMQSLIGFVYINPREDILKFSYVGYWGGRCEITLAIDDIVVLENKRAIFSNIYQKLHLQSDKRRKFIILKRHGIVVEPYIFSSIFGD